MFPAQCFPRCEHVMDGMIFSVYVRKNCLLEINKPAPVFRLPADNDNLIENSSVIFRFVSIMFLLPQTFFQFEYCVIKVFNVSGTNNLQHNTFLKIATYDRLISHVTFISSTLYNRILDSMKVTVSSTKCRLRRCNTHKCCAIVLSTSKCQSYIGIMLFKYPIRVYTKGVSLFITHIWRPRLGANAKQKQTNQNKNSSFYLPADVSEFITGISTYHLSFMCTSIQVTFGTHHSLTSD